MARYHQIGRFSENQIPNLKSSLYHLTKAANCGNVDSLYTLAHIYLQQPHEEFEELTVEVCVYWEGGGGGYTCVCVDVGLCYIH